MNLSQAFADQKVRVKEEDGMWQVSFMQYEIGYFDLETGRVEPVNNPFGPKVLAVRVKIVVARSCMGVTKFWAEDEVARLRREPSFELRRSTAPDGIGGPADRAGGAWQGCRNPVPNGAHRV